MTQEKKGTIRGAGRVGFLARQEGIKKMIEAGHPLLSIYQEYEKDMSISYSQFVKYVHKFIRSKPNEGEKAVPAVETKLKERSIVVEPSIKEFKRSEKRDDLFKPKS